jgi:hypothetical protein
MAIDTEGADLTMDSRNLYREEVFTDRRAGTIRVLTPVTSAGTIDTTRTLLYVGEAQILTAGGVLPLVFDIEARSLGEAVEGFAAASKLAVERAISELQELRREAASSIIVADRIPGGLGGPGGTPRGGIVQLP